MFSWISSAVAYVMNSCTQTADVACCQHLQSASQRKLIVPRHRLDSYGRPCFDVNLLPESLRTQYWVSTYSGISCKTLWRPLLPYDGYSYKHPMSDRVKPSFVIFDIQALRHSGLNVRVPGCQKIKKYKWRLNPVWHRMLYSCTNMTAVGVKELTKIRCDNQCRIGSCDLLKGLLTCGQF